MSRHLRRKGHSLRKRYGRSYTAKPLAFPEVKSFDELFVDYAPWNSTLSRRPTPQAIEGIKASKHGQIGPYLSMRDGHSLAVRPSPAVVQYVKDNMLPIVEDHIYFEVIDRGEGESLVTASYNKIIGSRWLALIKTSTVPRVD